MTRALAAFALLVALPGSASAQGTGGEVAALIAQLDDPDPYVRDAAFVALARIGGPVVVRALIEALSRPDPDQRKAAARALAGYEGTAIRSPVGPDGAKAAVSALVGALQDPVADVRAAAANGLGGVCQIPAVAVPALAEALEDPDKYTRWAAARAVGSFGPAAAPAVPALARALSDGDTDASAPLSFPLHGTRPGAVRAAAAESLFLVGAPALPAVPALVAALDDPVPEVRSGAGFVLGELGRALGRSGGAPWWVVPRVYAKELGGLAALLVVWFAIAARVPRRRPASGLAQTALFTLTASVPAALAAGATHHAVTREWARGFLPQPVLTLLPTPAAAVVTAALVCLLAAVGVCWGKPRADPPPDRR